MLDDDDDDDDAAKAVVGVFAGRNEATARMESEANCKKWRRWVTENKVVEEDRQVVVVVAVNGRKASFRNT